MNYELALELKNAGFPQKKDGTQEAFPDFTVAPTLEELIEACGENFMGLYKYHNGWMADYANKHEVRSDGVEKWDDFIGCKGSTPSEAVAKLYLALNKK